MASYGPAVDRIVFVLTGKGRTSSPATISGGEDEVYSYGLCIAAKLADGRFEVKRHADNSVTTNRHIRACHMAMREIGYFETGFDARRTFYSPRTIA